MGKEVIFQKSSKINLGIDLGINPDIPIPIPIPEILDFLISEILDFLVLLKTHFVFNFHRG